MIAINKASSPSAEKYTVDWANHRECHIAPDWLLIYQIKESILVLELTRTGTHADLF